MIHHILLIRVYRQLLFTFVYHTSCKNSPSFRQLICLMFLISYRLSLAFHFLSTIFMLGAYSFMTYCIVSSIFSHTLHLLCFNQHMLNVYKEVFLYLGERFSDVFSCMVNTSFKFTYLDSIRAISLF